MTGKRKPAKATKARRPKFLDPAAIDVALAEIDLVTRAEGVRAALVGGGAMQLYGSDRFTADLDVAIDRHLSDVKPTGTLTFGGIRTRATNGVPVDYIVRDDHYADLYDEAIDHAMRITDVPIPVATLPYLGAMKMASGRGKDIQDLEYILTSTKVSYRILRAIVVKHLGPYAADELDALRASAAITAPRRRQ